MAVNKQVILRYRVLNDCFRNIHRQYDIDDLVEACNTALSKYYDDYRGVSERTVRKDILDLQMPPYNVKLKENLYSGHKKIYRYQNPNYSLSIARISSKEVQRLRDAIDVLSNYEGLPQYDWIRMYLSAIQTNVSSNSNICVEFQNNSNLKGMEHFEILAASILNRQTLKLKYKKYSGEEFEYTLSPYLLKQFNDRWFLLCQTFEYEKLSVFPIDRIVEIVQSHKSYIESNVELNTYFNNIIGVTVLPDFPIEDIVLKVSKYRYPFIKTKPLHYSQTEVTELESDTHVVIKLNLQRNKELETLVLSYGNDLEVLSPESFRNEIKQKIDELHKVYSNIADNLQS